MDRLALRLAAPSTACPARINRPPTVGRIFHRLRRFHSAPTLLALFYFLGPYRVRSTQSRADKQGDSRVKKAGRSLFYSVRALPLPPSDEGGVGKCRRRERKFPLRHARHLHSSFFIIHYSSFIFPQTAPSGTSFKRHRTCGAQFASFVPPFPIGTKPPKVTFPQVRRSIPHVGQSPSSGFQKLFFWLFCQDFQGFVVFSEQVLLGLFKVTYDLPPRTPLHVTQPHNAPL